MKRQIVLGAFLMTMIAAVALAQATTPGPRGDQDELSKFQAFIVEHPRAFAELQQDPSQISNPEFAKKHRRVGEYITEHPKVKDLVKANPHFLDGLKATRQGGQGKHKNQTEDPRK